MYTVYIYGSGQPYKCFLMKSLKGSVPQFAFVLQCTEDVDLAL